MNEDFGIDFIARCIASEGLETANKRQWKLQAGPRILLKNNPKTQETTISVTGEDITVDDALSTTSKNPVQNKVITNELLTKPTCVLPNGNKVNNQKIMQLTRAQYDAIQNKDPNTYYMITDDAADERYTAGEGIDITNGVISLDVQYGASLEMTINPDTYVLTATLKDQDGGTLGTAQTVDLPLETMVVGGSYNDATKKVILTLQNGNTIEFSVADLVSGLETTAHAASTYLTQNDAANTYATQLSVSNLKTVPAVTSSDDGKILTADYTGGVASYSWQPAGGYTLPYASQSTKGGVRAWTTTEGGETVLNIATED